MRRDVTRSAAGTFLTWKWSVVCTGCGVHRVHQIVHNNSPGTIRRDAVIKKLTDYERYGLQLTLKGLSSEN
jgi:hypothetical protein